ncbi:MAG: hypothetical protein DCC71_18935 [Proteobacteria bacterium]|nr:MAG: hypothetical protein DCC71_18935 [Pseudomonadota bacterium]
MTPIAKEDCPAARPAVRVAIVRARGNESGPGPRPERLRTASAAATRRASIAIALACALFAAPAAEASREREAKLPRRDLLERALSAYRALDRAGRVRNPVLTVIDYARPSSQRRLWVIEPATRRVLFHDFVAHGRGSAHEADPDRLVRYGNEPASLRSSRGVFLTGSTYTGQHGHSLELHGQERGVNDRAWERRIVMHPADYASASFRAQSGGRLGRSWGCPALDPAVSRKIIDRIRDGGVLFVDGVDGSETPTRVAGDVPGRAAGGVAAAAAAGFAHGR